MLKALKYIPFLSYLYGSEPTPKVTAVVAVFLSYLYGSEQNVKSSNAFGTFLSYLYGSEQINHFDCA